VQMPSRKRMATAPPEFQQWLQEVQAPKECAVLLLRCMSPKAAAGIALLESRTAMVQPAAVRAACAVPALK